MCSDARVELRRRPQATDYGQRVNLAYEARAWLNANGGKGDGDLFAIINLITALDAMGWLKPPERPRPAATAEAFRITLPPGVTPWR